MTTKDLDALLKYFYNNRRQMNKIFFDDIKKDYDEEKRFSEKEMLILVYKLVDEGFVTRKNIGLKTKQGTEIIETGSTPGFYISFNGIQFYESASFFWLHRPYAWKKTKSIINVCWTVVKTLLIAANAAAIIVLTYRQTQNNKESSPPKVKVQPKKSEKDTILTDIN